MSFSGRAQSLVTMTACDPIADSCPLRTSWRRFLADDTEIQWYRCRAQEEKSVLSRLAIAFVLTLAVTAVNAQDTKSEASNTPAVASANGTTPFLFFGGTIMAPAWVMIVGERSLPDAITSHSSIKNI